MQIKYTATPLEGVFIIEPQTGGDGRGWFSEVYKKEDFAKNVRPVDFVQENESYSTRGVIRGLHYQLPPFAQGKLVRVLEGAVIDVAVDIRSASPTFGRHIAVELSAENHRQLWVPRGFAHGFSVTGPAARICYKCDNVYSPAHEAGIRFDDERLAIDWRIPASESVFSVKDAALPSFEQAKKFEDGGSLY